MHTRTPEITNGVRPAAHHEWETQSYVIRVGFNSRLLHQLIRHCVHHSFLFHFLQPQLMPTRARQTDTRSVAPGPLASFLLAPCKVGHVESLIDHVIGSGARIPRASGHPGLVRPRSPVVTGDCQHAASFAIYQYDTGRANLPCIVDCQLLVSAHIVNRRLPSDRSKSAANEWSIRGPIAKVRTATSSLYGQTIACRYTSRLQ